MPSDWRMLTVKDFATIATGARNTQDRKADGAYPFFVRSQKIERIDSFSFDGEAVLTAGDGAGTGKVFHYVNGRFDVHQRVYRMTGFSNAVSGRYFYYYFSRFFYRRIMGMTAKSSVDSVRREMIADMEIAVPPRDEQERIVAVLDDIDALLLGLDRLIRKQHDLRVAAHGDLIRGRRRVPGFADEWETRRLGDVLRIRHGKSQRRIEKEDGRYPILGTSGEIGRTDTPLHPGPSVLIGRKGTIDTPRFSAGPFWSIDTLFFTDVFGADPKFMYFLFQAIPWLSLNEASGVPSLNASTIGDLEVQLPPVAEQRVIADILSDFDAEIELLSRRYRKTVDLRTALGDALLTGRTRV
jgi:type I restriction enzyme S subunit